MQRRAFGIETEFAFVGSEADKNNARDFFLPNGGRFYIDVGHPEYSTPECDSARELVAYDKAGELLTQAILPGQYYKNNTDGKLHKGVRISYGCHENYLTTIRDYRILVEKLMAFLVTRPIITGAGGGFLEGKGEYCISPRAVFMETLCDSSTTTKRSIINTKDEAHADDNVHKRLHLIMGDSNMSEFATFMKMITTAIALTLVEEDFDFKPPFINNPLAALHRMCWNIDGDWKVDLPGGKPLRATDVQRAYLLQALKRSYDKVGPEWKFALDQWGELLDKLDYDPGEAADRIEWVNKKVLLFDYRDTFKLKRDDMRLMNIELQYTDTDRNDGIFYSLQKQGKARRVVTDAEIANAIESPPRTTRAWFRGNFIKRSTDPDNIVGWKRVCGRGVSKWDLYDPLWTYENYLPGVPQGPDNDRSRYLERVVARAKKLLF
jgi:proteasome accessory factor A